MRKMASGTIKYSDRIIKELGNKYVILHNVNNSRTEKITKELYDVIDYMCREKIETKKILDMCKTEEDKIYFIKKCNELLQKEFLREEEDNSEYINLNLEINWDITNRCNLKCKHCCVDAGMQYVDLNKDTMFQIIDKIVAINPQKICISGGEPLIRTDFIDIIRYLRKNYRHKLFLMTNAILINHEIARFIVQNFDGVSVSLDGIDEYTCAAVRGRGTFEKTIKGIEYLNEAGITFLSASMLLTKLTANKRQAFKDLCQKINAVPMYRALSLDGRASREMHDLMATDQEIYSGRLNENNEVMLYTCGAASKQYQVDYKGNIFPCQSLMLEKYKLGNVLEIENLYQFIRKRKLVEVDGYKRLEQLFPENLHNCQGCNKHIFCFTCLRGIHYNMSEIEKCCRNNTSFDRYFE